MTPELQKYYEECIATLKSPGWKYLLEDLRAQRAVLNDLKSCDTAKVEFQKGQLDQLDYMLGIDELYEAAYDRLVEEAKAGE